MKTLVIAVIAALSLIGGSGLVFAQTTPHTWELAWQDNSTNEKGFGVERSRGPNGPWVKLPTVVGADVISYKDTVTDVEGTEYCYRVFAFNDVGESTRTNQACDKIPVTPVNNAPSNLIIKKITQTSLELRWRDNSSNELAFSVERKTKGWAYEVLANTTPDIQIMQNTKLHHNWEYCYRVRALFAHGSSDYTNEACIDMKLT